MNEVALRRRIAALVIAALLAVSGAAVMAASFAADDARADDNLVGNTGNAVNGDSIAQELGVSQNQ